MGGRDQHPRKTARAWRPEWLLALLLAACGLVLVLLPAAPAYALDPVNPVTVPVGGHPANSGFLAFVEGDISVTADESEGTMAMGGDLIIGRNYNIAAGSPPANSTFIAPGDVGETFLYVGGGVQWPGGGVSVFIENGGFTKIANTATYDAFNVDNNGATVNYRIVPQGQPYTSNEFIDGRTPLQTPASIETPVPSSLIDIPAAFATYRGLTQEMAACPATVQLTSPDPPFEVLDPIDPGDRGVVTLTPGQTNVLTLTAEDLNDLAEITYATPPTVTTPLLINVTGTTFNGDIPNQAGIGGSQAPYILWNFPDATGITVNSGATLEGTLYAPNAVLTWLPSQNIEGNIIAAQFSHGPRPTRTVPRELHDFPFAATLSCAAEAPTAELTLVKAVINDDGGTADAGDWTLTADGPTPVTGTGDSTDVVDQTVDPGDYALAESGGPPGYTASDWICDGGTLDGTTLTLADGDDVVCTITNDDDEPVPPPTAELTLVKAVINDDGGTADAGDWTLTADGPTPVTGTGDSTDVVDQTVDPGDYALAESGGPPGYTASDWICDGGTLDGTTLTLADGDDVVCTITNDDDEPVPPPTAELTLVKAVINDDGGTADAGDWTLTADGPTPVTGTGDSTDVVDQTVDPGDYALAESGGPPGYTASDWICDGGTLDGTTLTLADGDDVVCTITNDDDEPVPPPTAELTLVKAVINDDGGTADAGDWTLTADGPTPVTGTGDSTDVVDQTVDPGDYALAESGGPPGYTASDWICDGGTLDGTTLTLADGDDVVCTITNDDDEPEPSPSATATTISPSPGTSPSATGGTGTDPIDSSDVDPSGALPDTGGPSWVWFLLALAALFGGTALLRSSRARPGQDADT